MKILAADDEKIALEGLENAIREAEPSAEVYGFGRAGEALEFFRENVCDIAFLDIQMRNISGIGLAKQLKVINPGLNIIFTTGYSEYMGDAFDMHASGYLLKPITSQKVRQELDNLRHPVEEKPLHRVKICTFGNFEVFVGGNPLKFRYDLTKEMFAYLVDRCGATVPMLR